VIAFPRDVKAAATILMILGTLAVVSTSGLCALASYILAISILIWAMYERK